jgi:hypothetical protein
MPRPTKRVERGDADTARPAGMPGSRRGRAGLALRTRIVLRCVAGLIPFFISIMTNNCIGRCS